MRSKELDLTKYNTDKIGSEYLNVYDPVFDPLVEKEISLLELGIFGGASLLLWKDYFPKSNIAGIDLNIPADWIAVDGISIFEGNQIDTKFLSEVANKVAPEGFDVIIDDASHEGALTKISFWHLFRNHLKSGGIYVLEDWGTGYRDNFPDGKNLDLSSYNVVAPPYNGLWKKVARRLKINTKWKWPSHSYGMVGLVKQLIDEQAAYDITHGATNGIKPRRSEFGQMIITPGLVFIFKA